MTEAPNNIYITQILTMLTAVFSTRRVLIRRCSVTLTQAVLACPPAVTSISSGATQVYFTHLNTRQPHSITPELNSVFDTAAAHAQLPSQVSCKHASLTIACSQRRHLSGTASSCGGHTFSAGTNINANTTTGNNSGNSGSGNTNSNTSSPQKLPEGVLVVPFPKLSHTMTTGQLVKWHKAPGDKVNMYDVLFELATEEIAEPEYRIGDFAGNVVMLVEAQDEGWLAQRLVQEGESMIQVGTPVAVVCDDQEQAAQLASRSFQCPTTNVYDEAQPRVDVLTWQSYLKRGKRQVKCMG